MMNLHIGHRQPQIHTYAFNIYIYIYIYIYIHSKNHHIHIPVCISSLIDPFIPTSSLKQNHFYTNCA